MKPTLTAFACFSLLSACGVDTPTPDAKWQVTVQGNATNCFTEDSAGYQETFVYEVHYPNQDASTEIRIDGEVFASGYTTGCTLDYTSPVWLEERDQGFVKWQITGQADAEPGTDGCSLEEGIDWEGTEVITIEESADPDVPEGCTYTMVTKGTYVGQG